MRGPGVGSMDLRSGNHGFAISTVNDGTRQKQCRGQRSRSPSFMKRSCHIGCLSFLNMPLKVRQFLSMADCARKLSTCGEKNEKQLAFLVSKGQILIVLLRMQLFIAFQSWAEAWLKGCQPMPAVVFPKLLCFGWLKGCHCGVS